MMAETEQTAVEALHRALIELTCDWRFHGLDSRCGWPNCGCEKLPAVVDRFVAAIGLPIPVLAWAAAHPDVMVGLVDGTMVARWAGSSFDAPGTVVRLAGGAEVYHGPAQKPKEGK